MELMCSLAIQSEPVVKRLNAIFEEHVLKEGHNEMEKSLNEAYKVWVSTQMISIEWKWKFQISFDSFSYRTRGSTFKCCFLFTTNTQKLFVNNSKPKLVSKVHSIKRAVNLLTEMQWLEKRRTQISVPNRWPHTVTFCWKSPTRAWKMRSLKQPWMT